MRARVRDARRVPHMSTEAPRRTATTGDRCVVTAERVAHGGHVVARHEGQVVFVRHGLPGERLEVVITGSGPKGRFLRADVVSVLEASPDRVEPPCAHAGSCGGCDWQHASLDAQRRLKAEVVREQVTRVLLERLIVNRPHPWGLLITFIELIKNPRYAFWRRSFTHAAPELERVFESVARSCMGPSASGDH